MAEIIKSSFRGLLVPDARVKSATIDKANSTYSEAGNLPGVPEAQRNTDLVLQSSGTQAAAGALNVKANRGGFPIVGQAGFVWKNSTDAATLYRGCDFPTAISSWQNLVGATSTSVSAIVPQGAINPHAITLSNGKVVVACNISYAAAAVSADRQLYTQVLDPADYAWDTAVKVTERTNLSGVVGVDVAYHPTLVELPSGRLLCFALYRKSALDVSAQVDFWYSDDEGATWSLGGENLLPDGIPTTNSNAGYTLNRCRAKLLNGQISLVISGYVNGALGTGTYADELWQYASDDYGFSFSLVDLWPIDVASGAVPGASPDLEVSGGFLILAYLDATTNQSVVRRSGSAFIPFRYDAAKRMVPGVETEMTTTGGNPNRLVIGNVALWVDDDGALYGLSQITANAGRPVVMSVSRDHGQTWAACGYNLSPSGGAADAGNLVTLFDDDTYPRDFACVAQGGRSLMVCNREAAHSPASLYKTSLDVIYLGGYSTVTMPRVSAFSRETRRVGWDRNWYPIEDPANVGWVSFVAGAGAATLSHGYLRIQSGPSGADDAYYRETFSTMNLDSGAIVLADLKVVDAPDPATDTTVILDLHVGDGSTARGYKLRAALGESKILWQDIEAGSTLATTTGIDTTNGVQILFAMRETTAGTGKASAWYRIINHTTQTDDRVWVPVLTNQTMTNTGSAIDGIVNFGAIDGATASVSSDSHWYSVNFCGSIVGNTGDQLAAGQTNPTDLLPKPFRASPMWINDGLKLAAVDGPAWRDDSWNVDTRYTYPLDHVYPLSFPSPRTEWRSTALTAHTLVWDLESLIAYDTLGILLEGINWRTATLSGWNESGSTWATLMSLDAAAEFLELPYNRVDDTITVKTDGEAASGTRYIHENEMRDGVVDLGSSKFRTITDNAAGIWRTQDTVQLPSLRIGGADGTEPANGLCNIWAPRLLGVASGVANKYTKLKLVIDAQTTPDGYFKIGSVVIGQAHLLAHDYSWARNLATTTNTQLTTTRDGTRAARVLGPSRRSVAFGWSEPVDVSPISGLYPFPDYYKVSGDTGAAVVASKGNTPATMRGIVEGVDGSAVPVVYLANVPRFEPTSSSSKSAAFNGSAHAASADATCANFERTDAFSISFWFRRTTVSTIWHRIIDKQVSTTATGYSLSFYGADPAEVSWRIEDDSTNEIRINTNIDTFDDDAWHHVVCSYDGLSSVNGLAIYVDGIAQSHTQNGTTIASTIQSGTVFRVGGSSGGLLANLDDMTIWGKALDVSEVRRVFNHGTPGSASANLNGNTPLHHWKMGDGDTLPTLTDSGSNPKNLTATNVTFADDAPGYGPGSDIANGVYQTTSRDRFLYGRVLGNVELDTVLGEEDDPDAGELMTIGALTIEEEI